MKRLLLPLLSVCLLLTACSAGKGQEADADSILVYRLIAPEYQTSGELVKAESIPLAQGEDPVAAAIAALRTASENPKLKSPLPAGVRIVGGVRSGSEAKVELSAAYVLLTGMNKTILDYCLTLTMCSIPGIEQVSLISGGDVVESGLRASDVLMENTVLNPEEAKVRLYYPADSSKLRYEYRVLSISDESSAERAIAEALLLGPESPQLYPALPAGTILLSIYTQDGICTVSLSEEFITACSEQPDNATLWVYSVVNTLCSLSSITGVQILVEGNTVSAAGNCDISRPLVKNEKLTGSPII